MKPDPCSCRQCVWGGYSRSAVCIQDIHRHCTCCDRWFADTAGQHSNPSAVSVWSPSSPAFFLQSLQDPHVLYLNWIIEAIYQYWIWRTIIFITPFDQDDWFRERENFRIPRNFNDFQIIDTLYQVKDLKHVQCNAAGFSKSPNIHASQFSCRLLHRGGFSLAASQLIGCPKEVFSEHFSLSPCLVNAISPTLPRMRQPPPRSWKPPLSVRCLC